MSELQSYHPGDLRSGMWALYTKVPQELTLHVHQLDFEDEPPDEDTSGEGNEEDEEEESDSDGDHFEDALKKLTITDNAPGTVAVSA